MSGWDVFPRSKLRRALGGGKPRALRATSGCERGHSGGCFPMNPPDPPEGIESDPAYHSHKPGERHLSQEPVVFPEKESGDQPLPADESEE
jgi:hypothetical protein